MTTALITVAMGDTYIRQTEVMVESFLRLNPGWEVIRYYDDQLDAILPDAARGWNPFSQCEIGRWYALQAAVNAGYDMALYCDGDMYWYAPYQLAPDAAMVLSPHYLLPSSRRQRTHWLIKDGIPNLGLIRVRHDGGELLDVLIHEVMRDPRPWFHSRGLWLQTIAGIFAMTGWDVAYDVTPGINIGNWNLSIERTIVEHGGRPCVRLDGADYPLIAMHYSRYPSMRGKYGAVFDRLLADYMAVLR